MNTAFFKSLTLAAALALPVLAFADQSNEGPDHHAMSGSMVIMIMNTRISMKTLPMTGTRSMKSTTMAQ